MPTLGLERNIVDPQVHSNSVNRFRDDGILLPRFSQLANPQTIPESIRARLSEIDPDEAHPLNLFRVHWYNPIERGTFRSTPEFIELPATLTGVDARIVVLPADRFPMIHAHKVLASYGCLVPRVLTGQFDPQSHRAIWPSTGNYCRGGIAVSRIMDCRGVAVLPEGMSRERFDWLEAWVSDPQDIIRTPGTESNVKEIYDKCAELDHDPHNIIFNQFSEFGNYLIHYLCTGKAVEDVFDHYLAEQDEIRLRAFVSATGSGGTLATGDFLKPRHRSWNVAVEALECPTLLYNGFGEHNIQGIGDKHVPLIHNVMGTDAVVAISDKATDELFVLFNSDAGRSYLISRRGVPPEVVSSLHRFGFSSICNILAAIKIAKYRRLGTNDLVVTVATDGAELYASETEKILENRFCGRFDTVSAAEVFAEHLLGCKTDHLLELTQIDRERLFNLGYFTWVEQQGISFDDFIARRDESFWLRLHELIPVWDVMIEEFNSQTGVADRL
jgi:cysteine synthase A